MWYGASDGTKEKLSGADATGATGVGTYYHFSTGKTTLKPVPIFREKHLLQLCAQIHI